MTIALTSLCMGGVNGSDISFHFLKRGNLGPLSLDLLLLIKFLIRRSNEFGGVVPWVLIRVDILILGSLLKQWQSLRNRRQLHSTVLPYMSGNPIRPHPHALLHGLIAPRMHLLSVGLIDKLLSIRYTIPRLWLPLIPHLGPPPDHIIAICHEISLRLRQAIALVFNNRGVDLRGVTGL